MEMEIQKPASRSLGRQAERPPGVQKTIFWIALTAISAGTIVALFALT